MTFPLSKIFWFLAAPSNSLLLGLAVGWLLIGFGVRRLGFVVLALASLGLGLAVALPLGPRLAAWIEARFPQPELPAHVDGIVILGGSVDQTISAERGQVALSDSAERLTVAVELASRFPQARLLFTGGSGMLRPGDLPTEAELAEQFWRGLGLDTDRVAFEGRSRNTWENAVLSHELAAPQPGQIWLLVTSALHMPRAVGCFRRAGWSVVAYPVDFSTEAEPKAVALPLTSHRLRALDLATHELVGLIAYRLLGRTDRLIPAP